MFLQFFFRQKLMEDSAQHDLAMVKSMDQSLLGIYHETWSTDQETEIDPFS